MSFNIEHFCGLRHGKITIIRGNYENIIIITILLLFDRADDFSCRLNRFTIGKFQTTSSGDLYLQRIATFKSEVD